MVKLVLLLQAAQDRHGVLHRGLVDEQRLEAAGERGVLLDVLAVLVERGRADAVELTARQSRLQEVGGVHRPVALAGADQRVHLVDEEHHVADRLDFGEHRLQPLLELAAILRTGDERTHVEAEELLVLQALGRVAVDDAKRQPLGDRGLADAGLANQDRVVLGAARQDLDRAADLLVAADHRVELAVTRRRGEVGGVLLQRVVVVLGARAVGGAALAQVGDRAFQPLRRQPGGFQDLEALGRRFGGERQQQPFDCNVRVSSFLCQTLGLVEHFDRAGHQAQVARAGAVHLRHFAESALDGGMGVLRPCPRLFHEAGGETVRIVQQSLQDMLGRELLMPGPDRVGLGGLDEAARTIGKFFDVHRDPLVPARVMR